MTEVFSFVKFGPKVWHAEALYRGYAGDYTRGKIRKLYNMLKKEFKKADIMLNVSQPYTSWGVRSRRKYILTIAFHDEADESLFIFKNTSGLYGVD
jgi:hypothetical protein